MEIKNMATAAVAMLVMALICLIGVAILDQTSYTMKSESYIYNETITAVNATYVASAHDEWLPAKGVTVYTNATRLQAVPESSVGYRLDPNAGALMCLNDDYAKAWVIDYYYKGDNSVSTAASIFKAGLQVFGAFSALVVLIMIGMIVIKQVKGGLGAKK